jgi:hypothetical protein
MSSWSECFVLRESMRLRGSMNLDVKVSAYFDILLYHSLTLLELFEVLFHILFSAFTYLRSIALISLLYPTTRYIPCVVINHQKGGDCAHLAPLGMFR